MCRLSFLSFSLRKASPPVQPFGGYFASPSSPPSGNSALSFAFHFSVHIIFAFFLLSGKHPFFLKPPSLALTFWHHDFLHDTHPSFASVALAHSFVFCMSSIGCTWLPWRAPSYSTLLYQHITNKPISTLNPSFQRNIPYPAPYLHPDQDNLLFSHCDHNGYDMHSWVCFLGPLLLCESVCWYRLCCLEILKK